jgi:hypothetical protein
VTGQALAVSDVASNPDDQIRFYAKRIGTGNKRRVFAAVYHGKKRIKEVDDLATKLDLTRKDVLWLGKQLADIDAVRLVKNGGAVVGYERVARLKALKKHILSAAASRKALDKVPSKTRPHVSGSVTVRHVAARTGKAVHITIHEVDSFSRVRRIKSVPERLSPERLPEIQFKHGVRLIIGDQSTAQDWGGEYNDLATTHLQVNGRRVSAAFAFKGPGKSGPLTPKKMGKLGNQVQRLVDSPSCPDVVFVQYEGDIDESLVQQLRTFAEVKAREQQRTIRYGTIDKVDSYRLRLAYATDFERAKRFVPRRRRPRS